MQLREKESWSGRELGWAVESVIHPATRSFRSAMQQDATTTFKLSGVSRFTIQTWTWEGLIHTSVFQS